MQQYSTEIISQLLDEPPSQIFVNVRASIGADGIPRPLLPVIRMGATEYVLNWIHHQKGKKISPLHVLCSIIPLDVAFPWKGTAATIASKTGAGAGRKPAAPGMAHAMMFLGVCIARSLLRPRIPLDKVLSSTFPVSINVPFVVADWNSFHRNLTFSNRADQLPAEELEVERKSGRLGAQGSSREAIMLKYPPRMFVEVSQCFRDAVSPA